MIDWTVIDNADLDALPVGTHILSQDGGICKKLLDRSDGGGWWAVNNGTSRLLPASIIFTPDELVPLRENSGSAGTRITGKPETP